MPPLGDRAVRADNTMPGDGLVRRREDSPDQARRLRVDVTVGLDLAWRDVPDSLQDGRDAGFAAHAAIIGATTRSSTARRPIRSPAPRTAWARARGHGLDCVDRRILEVVPIASGYES